MADTLPISMPRERSVKYIGWRQRRDERAQQGSSQAYVRPLETVTFFKNLGRFLTSLDDDWSEVVGNLQKSQKIRACLSIILGMKGYSPRV